jgi:hypothetical protein
MMQNRGTPGGRSGTPSPRVGGGGGGGGQPSGTTGGSTGGQRNIGFGYTRPPTTSTTGSPGSEQGHVARVVGSATGGAQTPAPPQFWVNHDPNTGVDRLHRIGCRHEQDKGETSLKGIEENKYDGGWHPFETEANARAEFPNAVWCQDCE